MDEIYEITGPDLDRLLRLLQTDRGYEIRKLSIAIDGGVKIKVNEYGWDLPVGELRTRG